MHKFSAVDVKTSLIGLIGDSIPDSAPKHHLIAAHIVVHAVFKLWHKSLLVDKIEVNQLICGHLDSDVTFDKVNETTDSELMVLLPSFFFGDLISFLFEKQHPARASCNEGLTLEKHHLTQIKIGHPLVAEVRETLMKIFRVKLDCVGHSLSIEAVDLLFILIIEAFVREILLSAVNFRFYRLLIFKNAFVLSVIQEMVVHSRVVVE